MSRDTTNMRVDAYRLPKRVCATCGKPTTGANGRWGEWHYNCRRDPKGVLIVKKEQAA